MSRRKKKKKGCLGCFIVFAVFAVIAALTACIVVHSDIFKQVTTAVYQKLVIPYQKVEIPPEQLEDKYYYQSLNEEEQLVYQELLQGMKDQKEEIFIHSYDSDMTNKLIQFVLNDYPEIFWSDGQGQITTYERGLEKYSMLAPKYLYNGEELQQRQKQIEDAADIILSGAPSEGTEYEKIKYVYEYIVTNTTYDESASDNQNIYSVLVGKNSVCAGYARAMQYLLQKMGIFCTYVTGTAAHPETGESIPHAWNIVSCDGEYYHVDATWGDPLALQEETGNIVYDYLCMNDAEIFRTHSVDSIVEFPACTSMNYNYYVMNGMFYPVYDSGQILQAMQDSINQQQAEITFKFADEMVYAEAKDDILNNVVKTAAEHLAIQYGLNTVHYSWQEEDMLNKLSFFWEYN